MTNIAGHGNNVRKCAYEVLVVGMKMETHGHHMT